MATRRKPKTDEQPPDPAPADEAPSGAAAESETAPEVNVIVEPDPEDDARHSATRRAERAALREQLDNLPTPELEALAAREGARIPEDVYRAHLISALRAHLTRD